MKFFVGQKVGSIENSNTIYEIQELNGNSATIVTAESPFKMYQVNLNIILPFDEWKKFVAKKFSQKEFYIPKLDEIQTIMKKMGYEI